MKIDILDNQLVLKEVYTSITLETKEGKQLHICMRDFGFEMKLDDGPWHLITTESDFNEPPKGYLHREADFPVTNPTPEKLSEKLKAEALQEDSDLAYMGKMKKALREERLESFEAVRQKLAEKGFFMQNISESKIQINTNTEFGPIEFFPKADRVFVKYHASFKNFGWYSKGLKWISKNLLKE